MSDEPDVWLKTTGGPAFPCPENIGVTNVNAGESGTRRLLLMGMSLRDWFAGNDTSFNALLNWSDEDLAQMARNRYRYADAMLAARSTEGEKP